MPSFLTPLAFALAALAAPIVALYFLKLRREEQTVSSTYLWRRLVRDTAANAPWQRLQPNLLLLLQLLFLLLLVLALARPYLWSDRAGGDHLILVLDTSASMQATDQAPDRLTAAVRAARRMVEALPAEARVTLIAAGVGTDVLVSGATDRSLVYAALDGLHAGAGGSDLSAALGLAAAIAARERDPETVIFSDGNVTLPATAAPGRPLSLPGRVRYVPVGEAQPAGGNQAILALSLRRTAGGQSASAFAQVANFGPAAVERRLSLYAGGELIGVRSLALPPGRPQPLTFDDLAPDVEAIEARLEGQDILPLDDRAWAVLPAGGRLRVDLVGPGNRFLETALGLLPSLDVTTIKAEDYVPGQGQAGGNEVAATPDGRNQVPAGERAAVTIFDGVDLPDELPAGALLVLAPLRSTPFFSVTGTISLPVATAAGADEPLLRYVDLRNLQIRSAAAVSLPAWARPVAVAEGSAGICAAGPGAGTGAAQGGPAGACPLIFAGETGGRRVAVIAFDVRSSDLPLRVAFPLLLANLVDYLSAGAGGHDLPESLRAGQPVPLTLPAEASEALVTLPDGTTRRLEARAGRAVFGETGALGIYRAAWTGSGGAGGRLGAFAVNLLDARESDLAAQATLAVSGAADGGRGGARQQSRQEWWRPLAWLALLALAAEWLYAHRGQMRQLTGRWRAGWLRRSASVRSR